MGPPRVLTQAQRKENIRRAREWRAKKRQDPKWREQQVKRRMDYYDKAENKSEKDRKKYNKYFAAAMVRYRQRLRDHPGNPKFQGKGKGKGKAKGKLITLLQVYNAQ